MNKRARQLAEGFLYTDMYELTMAQLYFRNGMHDTRAQFDFLFRSYPDYGSHQAGYCIHAGLAPLLDWMGETRIRDEEIERLAAWTGRGNQPVFSPDFLSWLGENGDFSGLDLLAVPEGRVVHPREPLVVVRGPLARAQILETPLLNHMCHQILIATKAARIRAAGGKRPVMEFGMRRAHGTGATSGARAALIGGADFSSNTGASAALGLPAKGTHAHSMIQAFMAAGGDELSAFRAYAALYPDDCILLVDTVDTLHSGMPNAIRVFEELRRRGHQPVGVRLDSGDLAHLAVEAAAMLDEAGFSDVQIVLSNQLDELSLQQILCQIKDEAGRRGRDAAAIIGRLLYGAGTRLITSAGDSALDGVYKLVALQRDDGWQPAVKVSESPAKTLDPGDKRVWRLFDRRGMATADLVGLADEDPGGMDPVRLRHPTQSQVQRTLAPDQIGSIEPLLEEVLRDGRLAADPPDLDTIRALRDTDLDRLDPGVRRIVNPHFYHVSLTARLWELKQALIEAARPAG